MQIGNENKPVLWFETNCANYTGQQKITFFLNKNKSTYFWLTAGVLIMNLALVFF